MSQGTSNPNDIAQRIASDATQSIEDARTEAAQEAQAQHADSDRDARINDHASRLEALENRPAAPAYDDGPLHAKLDAMNERLSGLAPQPAAPAQTAVEDKADAVEDARSTLVESAKKVNDVVPEPNRGNTHFLMRNIGSFFGRGSR